MRHPKSSSCWHAAGACGRRTRPAVLAAARGCRSPRDHRRDADGALEAMARRSHVSEAIALAIAGSSDIAAVTALLDNPRVQIREEMLDKLVDRAHGVPSWHRPLVHRPKLSSSACGSSRFSWPTICCSRCGRGAISTPPVIHCRPMGCVGSSTFLPARLPLRPRSYRPGYDIQTVDAATRFVTSRHCRSVSCSPPLVVDLDHVAGSSQWTFGKSLSSVAWGQSPRSPRRALRCRPRRSKPSSARPMPFGPAYANSSRSIDRLASSRRGGRPTMSSAARPMLSSPKRRPASRRSISTILPRSRLIAICWGVAIRQCALLRTMRRRGTRLSSQIITSAWRDIISSAPASRSMRRS
jgi:hypothetical protein